MSFSLELSLTYQGFDAIEQYHAQPVNADSPIHHTVQVVGKKTAEGIALALLAIIGAVESLVRSIFTGTLLLYRTATGHDVQELILQTYEGLFSAIRATAYSVYTFYVHLFGDDSLRLDHAPVDSRVNEMQLYFRNYL